MPTSSTGAPLGGGATDGGDHRPRPRPSAGQVSKATAVSSVLAMTWRSSQPGLLQALGIAERAVRAGMAGDAAGALPGTVRGCSG